MSCQLQCKVYIHCCIIYQTGRQGASSESLHSPAGQAQKPADRPKLAAVPAGMLLAAEHTAEPAVVVQNLSGAPDYSQHQAVDNEH